MSSAAAALAAEVGPRSDPDESQRIEAVSTAAVRLQQLNARTPDRVVPPSWVTALESAFDPVIAALESYLAGNLEGPFPVQWGEIERLWAALTPFVAASVPGESAAEDAASFRRSAGQLVRRLTDEVEEAEAQIRELRQQAQSIASEQAEVMASVREQQKTLEVRINEQAERLDQALRQNQAQFSDSQERYRTEFDGTLETHRDQLNAALSAAATDSQSTVVNVETQAQLLLGEIEELKEKATKSYNAIGTASVAGHFQEDADNERGQARLWRFLAVVAFLLIAIGTIVELAASGGSLEWEQTRSRLPVILGLAGFAAFAISESRNHRKVERASREREVKLSSIDPYLVLAENPAEASKVKLAFARALFLEIPSDDPEDDPEDQVDPG